MKEPIEMPRSLVLEYPSAGPSAAAAHFASRLALETDPSDVYSDMEAGISGFVVIDSRSEEAYRQAHIPGALSLPHRTINEHSTQGLSKEDVIVVYCWGPACNAAQKAGLRLSQLGFKVKEMIGGYEYWVKEKYPTEGTHAHHPPLYNPYPETLNV